MKLIPVKVDCHSGYKTDEYPVCFYLMNTKYEIKEIADRWFQAQATPEWPVADYYKVRTAANQEFILKHDLQEEQWFIVRSNDAVFGYSLN